MTAGLQNWYHNLIREDHSFPQLKDTSRLNNVCVVTDILSECVDRHQPYRHHIKNDEQTVVLVEGKSSNIPKKYLKIRLKFNTCLMYFEIKNKTLKEDNKCDAGFSRCDGSQLEEAHVAAIIPSEGCKNQRATSKACLTMGSHRGTSSLRDPSHAKS